MRAKVWALLLAGVLTLTAMAPGAEAASFSQAYYLFYRHDSSIHANCPGRNRYLAYEGIVQLRPYRTYTAYISNTGDHGYFQTVDWTIDGFSSAVRDLYCRNGDFVWEYFGMHKVQRTAKQVFYCYGMSCWPWSITTYSPWRSRNWI